KAEPFAADRKAAPAVAVTASADRSTVAAIKPQPDAAWAVKPSGAPPLPAGASLPDWPELFAATEAAMVPNAHTWVRYDLKTANRAGETRLWPENPPNRGPQLPPSDPTRKRNMVKALAPDGQRLAVTDPNDPARVAVWDAAGKYVIGLRPYADDPIDW